MNSWARVRLGLTNRVRRLFPNRRVRRCVQGVTLTLPWSHRLPDYAETLPGYGQNLVAMATILGEMEAPGRMSIIDVGANVGDSAVQVLNAVDADVICVEGDPYWLPFLRENTAGDPRVHVVRAMLLPSSQDGPKRFNTLRANGTTRFVPGGGKDAGSTTTPELLRASQHDLAPMRLIKSDTDGFDVRLLPDLARAYADTLPVLFFEFDPPLARETGDRNPERIWGELIALGYERCVVWDNFGGLLGSWSTVELTDVAEVLDHSFEERGYHYWDVAAIHSNDPYNIAIEQAFCT
jgi:FkbM family methyltransferase